VVAGRSREGDPGRLTLITVALRLVTVSVAFGLLSGAVSVITGLQDHSLGVFAVGLDVLADVTGSAVLIWRFRAERQQPVQSETAEVRAAIVVAVALVLFHTLGWWWADRIAALIVAAVAAVEAWHTAPKRSL
jgi:divalent metal cation (Fe/Co/Zn/Cd) transporter